MEDRDSIVYIINSLSVGGAEVGMCRLLRGLDPNKYKVSVVVLDGRNPELEDQVPNWANIIYLYSNTNSYTRSIHTFLRVLREADVIVGSLFHSSILARGVSLLNRDATVATWRHTISFSSKWRRNMFDLTNPLTDAVFADSKPVAERIEKETNLDADDIYTLPIAGIDLDEYTPVDHREKDQIVVGTVGRLTRSKNPQMVVEVAEQLRDSKISFKIAGEGELESQIKGMIHKKELENISLMGLLDMDEVPGFLSSVDIYFQPSLNEGLCMTVLEAMATELPIIGSDVGGIGYNVEDGQHGYLYDPSDIHGFANAIRRLADDPILRSRLGKCARQTIAKNYTQERFASEFISTIDKL